MIDLRNLNVIGIALALGVWLGLAAGSAAQIQFPGKRIIEQAIEMSEKPAPAEPVQITAPNPRQVVSDFLEHLRNTGKLDDQQLRATSRQVDQAMGQSQYDGELITRALEQIEPRFAAGIEALLNEQTDRAIALLEPLTRSDDPYLAAHASYYTARAHLINEDHESARPLLERLVGPMLDKTLYSGDALFMLGVCQAELLEREQAIATLKAFCTEYPHASERMVIGALHLIEELAAIQEGRLSDVSDRMDYSRRRLDLRRTAERTQGEQQRIITILDRLIKEAEDKENGGGGGSGGGQGQGQGQAQGQGSPSGNMPPGGPADQSAIQPGQGRMGALHRVHRGSPAESWGQRPDKEREEVLNAIRARFPERYRELVEQYYRSLQENQP
jgi:tetratricopeptide (TPR) repeat protein